MTKSEATALLGISPRSLERYVAQGRIPAARIKGKTGIIADYAPADVERLKRELDSLVTSATNHDTATGASEVTTALARLPLSVEASIERPDAPKRDRGDRIVIDATLLPFKRLFSLEECEALTGISKAKLRAAITKGQLKAGRVGRAFRVRPAALDEWVDSTF